MTDSFPRQAARTMGFTLGAPRSFRLSPDGELVIFLRSRGGTDPVTCMWVLDVASGEERLIADPAEIGKADTADDPVERARRERVRERAGGIVAFATDAVCSIATFGLGGAVYLADLRRAGKVRQLATATPAADPRPDPTGTHVAYVSDGALRVHEIATGADRALADPKFADGISFGLAEFLAAEEMDRSRGYWWAPDGSAILTARVDETPVQFWHIADPANPATAPRAVRYPAAGTPNADVSVYVATLAGDLTEVCWDSAALPYLVTASWEADTGHPLLVVASRDQRDMRILAVDPASGATSQFRADTDPAWVDIMTAVPASLPGGRIAWTADIGGAKRLVVGTQAEHAAGTAAILTPDSINVREVTGADGDTIFFTASGEDPATIVAWSAGPAGLERISPLDGVHRVQQAGGTRLLVSRGLADSATSVQVRRNTAQTASNGTLISIGSMAETPSLSAPQPLLTWSTGPSRVRTAILLPSWHAPGSARLPVLCDPYGGPHGQRVVAAGAAYLNPQWFAEQGFAVVIADGRGTPGRGPAWDRAVTGDLAGPVLADQVEALQSAAEQCADLDLTRVGIRGWSFGGYLSALAVLRRPDVFHAGIAGAPPIDWRLYDTCYTERYLGLPADEPDAYAQSSLLADAPKLTRPLLLIHGLADDNVVVAHSLRFSAALLAAGRPHSVLPLSGVTHMAAQEDVAENLLLLQVDFLRRSLGIETT
ncbi:MAG TPA: prolyl oligopeptidase family serine peptidase [Streptosporangiaceae bacterium]|nr:prolyl oligopeptidase family serine peptidase [Streptosporangiaceae bacterium]